MSVGLASWPDDARDRDSLLERADAALYAAKHAGKDRVVGAAAAAAEAGRENPTAARTNLLDLLRAKDPNTVTHSAHVAALAVEVGRRLGIDGDRLADLRTAGGLHDVGKLAVPDAILNKPAALDDEEMNVVRSHSVVGAELLRAAGWGGVARFVLEHHERVDGTGYPNGLTGDDISLEHAMALRGGAMSIGVHTGLSSAEDFERLPADSRPHLSISGVDRLLEMLA